MAFLEQESFRGKTGSLPSELTEEGELKLEPSLLSDQELVVLTWLAEGLSNKEIAHNLQISSATVKNHTSSILGKLDVYYRTEAALIYQWTVDICASALEKDGDPRVMIEGFKNTLKRVAQEGDDRLAKSQARLFELLEESAEIKKKERERQREEQEARKKRREEREEERREELWRRRRAVLLGLAEGRTDREIAGNGIEFWVVRRTITSLYKELGIDGRSPRSQELLVKKAREAWDI